MRMLPDKFRLCKGKKPILLRLVLCRYFIRTPISRLIGVLGDACAINGIMKYHSS